MLFSGMACFSPSVASSLRKGWVKNGGTLTHCVADFFQADFFFCSGLDDPWLSELLSRFLVVRHANWISSCISEQFLMPVAPYTLDDHFDLSSIALPEADSEPAASGHTSLNPKTAIFSKLADAQANSLKRSFQEIKADDSYPEIDPRLAKKPRIQADKNSPPASEFTRSAQKGLTQIITKATELNTAYDQPRSMNDTALQSDYASPPGKSMLLNATRRAIKIASTNRQDRGPSPETSQHGSPDALASQPKYSSKATSTMDAHNAQSESLSNTTTRHRHSFGNPRGFIIKVLKPPSEISARPSATATPQFSTSRLEVKTVTSQYTTSTSLSRKRSELVMKSLISAIKSPGPQPSTQPTIEASRTAFWKHSREAYSGSGPLVLCMADILRASKPSVEAKLFTKNGTYYDEKFGCVWR